MSEYCHNIRQNDVLLRLITQLMFIGTSLETQRNANQIQRHCISSLRLLHFHYENDSKLAFLVCTLLHITILMLRTPK